MRFIKRIIWVILLTISVPVDIIVFIFFGADVVIEDGLTMLIADWADI